MSRLTKKTNNFYNSANDEWHKMRNGKIDLNYVFELEQKLGRLEDIEEEFGIDLVTLFKALKNGAWFRNPYYLNEINFIKNIEFNIEFEKKRFDIRMDYFVKFHDYRTGGALFLFKDYGKTWALTKEELE